MWDQVGHTKKQEVIVKYNDWALGRQGNDYALLFAVDKYEDKRISNLSNPIFDAEVLAKELEENYNFKTEVLKNPSRATINQKLREYLNKSYRYDDQLFIFFSGHGIQDKDYKTGAFLPSDANKDADLDDYIPYYALNQKVDNIPCNHILLTIDACYSGTFDPKLWKGEQIKDVSNNPYKPMEKWEYVHEKLEQPTRYFLASGRKVSTSDGIPGYHSPFIRSLLKAFDSKGGNDGILTFGEIKANFDKDKLRPIPHSSIFGNHLGGDFLFIEKEE